MNNWLVASYKINELKILERNLKNQNFEYYLPKITILHIDTSLKEEILFPGYIFINTSLENYSALNFTKGIRNIIKFGNNISCLSEDDINDIKTIEESSKINPLTKKFQVGQDVFVKEGSLKGRIVQICSLPSKDRVDILLNILGSKKIVNIKEKDLSF